MLKATMFSIVLLLTYLNESSYAENYINNFPNAKKISQKEDKPILLIFSMKHCPHCDTLKDQIKNKSIEDFVICVVNAENNIPLVKDFSVLLYPTSIILEPKLFRYTEDDRFVGYSSDYWKWLDSSKK